MKKPNVKEASDDYGQSGYDMGGGGGGGGGCTVEDHMPMGTIMFYVYHVF